jgi:hypothetical protein
MEWQPIETAPKAGKLLLFGNIDPEHPFPGLKWNKPSVFSGYWDSLDEAWCPDGATWEGPFMDVTHWMPLPKAPE